LFNKTNPAVFGVLGHNSLNVENIFELDVNEIINKMDRNNL
jgi:hypothetical protein